MFRPTIAGLLICCGTLVPLSCSENGEKDGKSSKTNSGAGGTGAIDLEESTGGGGPDTSNDNSCKGKFVGLGTCGTMAQTAKTNPVNILLVIDKSGSMNNLPTPDAESTLWEATTTALKDALESTSEAIAFGLQVYPAADVSRTCQDSDCCEMPESMDINVPIEHGTESRQAIADELDKIKPGGGTPTSQALARAFDYFDGGDGEQLKGDRFVLLATDGGPNCNGSLACEAESCTGNIDQKAECEGFNCCLGKLSIGCLDDMASINEIEKLRSIGVGTFVVGLSGSERYADQLNAFAVSGGHARSGQDNRYFKVGAKGSAKGLSSVLDEITQELVQSCDIQLAEEVGAVNKLNVAVDCNIISYSSESSEGSSSQGQGGDGGDGGESSTDDSHWTLDLETKPSTVRLRGAICTQIETVGVKRVDILQGCQTVQ